MSTLVLGEEVWVVHYSNTIAQPVNFLGLASYSKFISCENRFSRILVGVPFWLLEEVESGKKRDNSCCCSWSKESYLVFIVLLLCHPFYICFTLGQHLCWSRQPSCLVIQTLNPEGYEPLVTRLLSHHHSYTCPTAVKIEQGRAKIHHCF